MDEVEENDETSDESDSEDWDDWEDVDASEPDDVVEWFNETIEDCQRGDEDACEALEDVLMIDELVEGAEEEDGSL